MCLYTTTIRALASVAQLVKYCTRHQKVTVWIPGQCTGPSCGLDLIPGRGYARGSPSMDVSLLLFYSKINKDIYFVKNLQ